MLTTSLTSICRSAGALATLLVAGVLFSADVAAQTPTVVASSAVAVPNEQANGAPWQSAVSNRGDFLLFDFKTSGFYQFPPNGGAQITLAAPGVVAGGFTDSGIAVDPRNNNIYLNNNYNGGLIEFPYDAATGTWDLPSVVVATGLAGNLGGSCGNYFQSAGMSMNKNGILAVATENGCGVEIFTVPIDLSGNFGAATPIVSNMKQRAKTVAIDDAGNIYYNADAGGFTGVGYIPAGTTGLADETTVTRIDPTLGNVQGVTLDNSGNIYIADGTAGEYFVPLEAGVPNPAHAVLIAPAQASGGPSFDGAHQTLFVPVSSYAGLTNEVKILINRVELGSSTVGTAGATPGTVTYSFSAATSPYNFVLSANGTSGVFTLGDVSGCGITLAPPDSNGNAVLDKNGAQARTTTPYAAGSSCSIPVTFTPLAAGDVSATLSMVDADGNILNTAVLHGVGSASAAVIAPDTATAITPALTTPSQIATDPSGNVYVADSGQSAILEFKKGSTTASAPVTIGTGLTAPTGVAVDAAGDVYIADSGNIVKVPFGLTGYDSTGQVLTGLNASGQATIKTGLGTNLKLAVDAVGDVFVADPDNQRVARLTPGASGIVEQDYTGFAGLTAIGVSGAGDLFVADGANLIEIPSFGSRTTILNSLAGATGLAVDASGAIYVTETGKTFRIPSEGGVYTPADQLTLAPEVTNPLSIALDSLGNAYVIDGTAKVVDVASTNGFINLGTLPTTTSTQDGTVTLSNAGNQPLNITAFTNTADFSETATTCIGSPLAVGSSCTATITFSAGPGDQGPLTGQIGVTSDAVNAPVSINAIGVGATLAASTASLTATNPTVTSAPVVVTVVSTSGAEPVPTGNVTLTAIANGKVTNTFVEPLVNGTVTINATEIQAGTYTFKASYSGDRVYGTSTASITVTVAPGAVLLAQPPTASIPQYILSQGTGAPSVYDGSAVPYEYTYQMSFASADGNPLVGVPVYGSNGNLVGVNYGTVTLQGTNSLCPPLNVNADGTAPYNLSSCLGIDTSNNQIPNLLTKYTITPVFTSANYATVMGTPFTVTAVRNPVVVITSDPASLSVSAGASATANLTLTSLLGFGVLDINSNLDNYSLPVELQCANLPPHTSCSFSYPTPDPSDANSVAVTPTTPGKVIMTLTTDVPVGTSTSALQKENPVAFAAMFGLSLLGLAFGRKRGLRVSLFSVLCILMLSGMVAGVVACGSGQKSTNVPVLNTPAGTYNVTVTAKQTGSKTVPGSLPGTTVVVSGNGNLMSLPFTLNVTVQ